ncbi:hypothetical protein [Spirosoma endophyticum]|uniref:Uncharacterized protein n=1 Tax=Spirosoma endophyticum TaxID=662367 RepID=A0A1I2ESN1_9BACT|nr:hypothetical protein [Spirosoma endophyticum]SFE95230.1 hypothetical protein SAMN05216167_1239 [Spirosoma endophyticum]
MKRFLALSSLKTMIPQQSEASRAIQLEFVADLSYNPRTHQYRVDLTEPYRTQLPRDRNYLLLDVEGFTVHKLLDAFQVEVVDYYQQKCEEARQALDRIRIESQFRV